MKTKKVSKKFLSILLGSLALSAASIAVVVPVMTRQNTSTVATNGSIGSNNGSNTGTSYVPQVVTSNYLKFEAVNSNTLTSQSNVVSMRTTSTEENKYNETKQLTTVSGNKEEVLVSKSYNNNRKYMPILAYDDQGDREYYGFSQSRSVNDVRNMEFPGWTSQKMYVAVETPTSKGNAVSIDASNLYLKNFTASEVLKQTYSEVNSTTVMSLTISLGTILENYGDYAYTMIDKIVQAYNVTFIRVTNINDGNVEKLPDFSKYENVKKISLSGNFSTIANTTFPEGLLELEINTDYMTSVDPLQIPVSAAMISEQGFGAKFTNIDLSKHKNLTTENLQKAIDIVYINRIKERAFQGNSAGGYIYSWNLRGTGIYTLNNVTIPEIDDGTGRFYIAYVAIETDGLGDSVIETLPDGNKPSNDSQINEWYDWNENGLQGVTHVTVSTISGASLDFDILVKEILGFINKYPNVEVIDISSIQLKNDDKTLEDVVVEVKKQLTNSITGVTKEIEIVTNQIMPIK